MSARALAETVRANTRTAQYDTFESAAVRELTAFLIASKNLSWPCVKYQRDPVGFARDILGINLIHVVQVCGDLEIGGVLHPDGSEVTVDYQAQIIQAVADCDRVAVTSGHKIGKSLIAACLAIWFFCSFPDARVFLTSSSYAQVENILWREIRKVLAQSGRCFDCRTEDPRGLIISAPCEHSGIIPEEPALSPSKGLKSEDFREIIGFSCKEPERVAGISGANILYLVDEASGVPDNIFEAIDGNRAGGAKLVLFSNPTRNAGRLFEAFHKAKKFWRLFRISSRRTVNYIAGRKIIGGMAERDWVNDMADLYGKDSAAYKVRVEGQHALAEEGRPFDHHTVAEAQVRNHGLKPTGRLYIGLDPAGDGERSDDSVFHLRRGLKSLGLHADFKGNVDELAAEARRLVVANSRADDTAVPMLVYDAEGPIGYKLGPALERVQFDDHGRMLFEIEPVRASDGAARLPDVYERQSAELIANLESYLKKDGGGLPQDAKLEEEMYPWEYSITVRGKRKVDKREVKKVIRRSPDRFDAVALSVWEPIVNKLPPAPPPQNTDPSARTAANARVIEPDWGAADRFDDYDDDESSNSSGMISPWD